MAEFPDLGKHCSVPECKILDWLPIKCDACSIILCKEHRTYDSHGCTEAYKKRSQFPVCPLCQQPIPTKRGEIPDTQVNEHIEQNCQSDLAKKRRMAPKCGMRNCFKRELVKMECKDCRIHFCLGHRHPSDHHCSHLVQKNNQLDKDHRTSRSPKKTIEQSKSAEQLDALFARQLQQEEYERAFGGNNPSASTGRQQNGNCTVS